MSLKHCRRDGANFLEGGDHADFLEGEEDADVFEGAEVP